MIIFFYGEDTFRMRQKLRELKEKFVTASLGDTNLAVLDGERITYDEFVRQILAMPFLSKTRLVIVENLLRKAKKDVAEKIPEGFKKMTASTVLVFVEEGIPDRRTALFRKLSKEKVEEFKLLEPESLRRWIKKEVETRGGTIDSAAILKLAEFVGNDLWRMTNEIDKLIAFGPKITHQNIEILVNPQIQANIFNLIDAMAQKNIKLANKELYRLLNSGANELYILTMIIYQYRNLLIIKDLGERLKNTNRWALAKKAGLHPFVIQKSLAVLPKYSLDQLKNVYGILQDFDVRMKTGKIESRVALELLIFKLAK